MIPGDGIGTEVVPPGVAALEATADVFGLDLRFEHFDFASAAYWQRHGSMLPPDRQETLSSFDALYFGAVGWPEVVPDHVSPWGSLLPFRRTLDQYVNLRPCRLMPGVRSPLAGREPCSWPSRPSPTATSRSGRCWSGRTERCCSRTATGSWPTATPRRTPSAPSPAGRRPISPTTCARRAPSTRPASTARRAPRPTGGCAWAASCTSPSAQLAGWLDELGVPAPPVRTLPVTEVAPGVPVDGPDDELAAQVRELHRRLHARP